jgi:hypothetical protein
MQPELKGVATRLRKTTTKAEKGYAYHGGIKTADGTTTRSLPR